MKHKKHESTQTLKHKPNKTIHTSSAKAHLPIKTELPQSSTERKAPVVQWETQSASVTFRSSAKTDQYFVNMSRPGLLYTDFRTHLQNLIKDVFMFCVLSFYYICESIFLTILPDRFRKLKVIISSVISDQVIVKRECLLHCKSEILSLKY